ncbi:hypothetical protein GCM10009678_79110 [Actinomadura kijaniata]|uniref:Uncharacterized protein n=1 Tax=Actinomadura namibiensis TaxID=182080 RepID=A0A7W3LYX0_ACTNM|nr:hypothetical protein [Actinomadura namibiensis]MBA8956913.1 hypothetical protein [Actinomadura namibiensis]
MDVIRHTLTRVAGGYRPNRCKRGDGPNGLGHVWLVFTAHATGHPRPVDGAMPGLHWAEREELAELAARTAARARGTVTDAQWRDRPGLEPVWCRWIVAVGLITMSADDLEAIDNAL